ncbi:Putative glycoside hydrolase, family 2, immunoglobulin-like beta-sandwich [Colletotrichum destructivum]|uniref:Beta-mannosidase B n=1 Tax=Colletotrichum destructivum TaxID=34406 RepID=A0AAX4IRA6_9PEZI|nr:Putative glycoside hydrolase, family 2, immunoglobulin-like beta-sandwich [Colletotrichum destructivum]
MALLRHELSSGWTFKQEGDTSETSWLPVPKIPSQVHVDLLANDKIPDPFLDMNELAVQWVAEKTWVYRASFATPAGFSDAPGSVTDLVFEGLDTFAKVTLNGTEILRSDNMFLSHRVGVSRLLKRGDGGENVLEIVFDSALLRGRQLLEEHAHEHRFIARQTEPGRIPVRKAQYHWGWDWGPILVTAGVWKPVFLEHYVARLEDVWVRSEVDADLKLASGQVIVNTAGSGAAKVSVKFTLDDEVVFERDLHVAEDGTAQTDFRLENPKLWYPLNTGPQTLYTITATLHDPSGTPLACQTKRTGFRRAELIQEPDALGKSFYFRINNVDVFAGGSCWIPADSFHASIEPARYRAWAGLMAASNQNMLRIWGGGVYEADALMDACDELGVMVWHDFCFACGSYPAYPSFLASVEQEARQNLRRLRGHPSIVIWAGNNEDYQVQEKYQLEYRFDEDKDPQSWLGSSFPARYLYENLLPKIVEQESPHTVYHPSSPWGDGKPTADPTVGDIHQWNIWHGAMNKYQDAHLLTGRFVSEFGMEGYPHLSTTTAMLTSPSQHRPGSMTLDFRNKAYDHEHRMMTYIAENLPIAYDLPRFTHLTQLMQAEAMSFTYKAWRRDWGSGSGSGTGAARGCGGALVWQLNDCWPTVSWAVVDYWLVPKPAFYAIARALRTLDVGVRRRVDEWTKCHADPTLGAGPAADFEVWVASGRADAVEGDLVVRFISIGMGSEVRGRIEKRVVAEANATTDVVEKQTVGGDSVGRDTSVPFRPEEDDPFVIHVTLAVDGVVVAEDTAWPQPLKYLEFSDRGVRVRSAGEGRLVVSAEKPVKGFVIQEERGMKLSDNGFDVVPGEERVVYVDGIDVEKLRWTYLGAPEASLGLSG